MNKPKLIIDTDAGHDDALAMMLLICSGLFDILAVTTVAGNSTIEKVTRNAQAVLDLIESQVPLHSGAASPLKRELVQANVHGDSGLDGLDVTKTNYVLSADAVVVMRDLVLQYPGEIAIVTLGPLTNIAELFINNVGIDGEIKQIITMGGAIEAPGNKNRVAEFNFSVDPEAAAAVLESNTPKVLVPLDPCNPIRVYPEVLEPLRGKKIYKPLMSMMEHFIAGIAKYEKVNAALVYDALAAYYAVEPSAFVTEPMDIVVETEGKHTFGMSVADRRRYSEKHSNVDVVTKIDRDKFELALIDALSNAP